MPITLQKASILYPGPFVLILATQYCSELIRHLNISGQCFCFVLQNYSRSADLMHHNATFMFFLMDWSCSIQLICLISFLEFQNYEFWKTVTITEVAYSFTFPFSLKATVMRRAENGRLLSPYAYFCMN